uniref:IS66 family insertion sequence element accessory protein TnpA n=1 Tax=Pararhodonellum marinum TaxID=2755358 RepID=UPI00188E86E4
SNDEYYDLFSRWQASGKSKAAFAQDEGISRTAFYYWCRKFSVGQPYAAGVSSFSLITPDVGFQRDPVLRISYPSGVNIEFFGKVEVDTVKRLL